MLGGVELGGAHVAACIGEVSRKLSSAFVTILKHILFCLLDRIIPIPCISLGWNVM